MSDWLIGCCQSVGVGLCDRLLVTVVISRMISYMSSGVLRPSHSLMLECCRCLNNPYSLPQFNHGVFLCLGTSHKWLTMPESLNSSLLEDWTTSTSSDYMDEHSCRWTHFDWSSQRGFESATLEAAGCESATLEAAGCESATLEAAGCESATLEAAGCERCYTPQLMQARNDDDVDVLSGHDGLCGICGERRHPRSSVPRHWMWRRSCARCYHYNRSSIRATLQELPGTESSAVDCTKPVCLVYLLNHLLIPCWKP